MRKTTRREKKGGWKGGREGEVVEEGVEGRERWGKLSARKKAG